MAKNKKFREWMEDDSERVFKEKKKDPKRYDKKKSDIQKARRQKSKQRNTYLKSS
jgi:hypothetical protein